jgi:hypothetical protein
MKKLPLAIIFSACSSATLAQTMQCPNGIVDSDQDSGIYKQEIRQKCGVPDEDNFTHWRYEREDFVYILSFEDDGELMSIDQQPIEEVP